ncbi:hypothetical protein D3C71_1104370 [compost metagenome]
MYCHDCLLPGLAKNIFSLTEGEIPRSQLTQIGLWKHDVSKLDLYLYLRKLCLFPLGFHIRLVVCFSP